MAEYSKKWKSSFEKKFSKALNQVRELEKEYKEMQDSNPDEWELRYLSIDDATLEYDNGSNLNIYHYDGAEEGSSEYIEIGVNGSELSSYSFKFYDLKELIDFRNSLMSAIDKFKRVEEEPKVDYSSVDDCDDEEDAEESDYEIKAERSLTESWTYTVKAKSACSAIKMLEEDPDQEGITHNDDSEYYDYGEVEYESI